MWIRKLSDCKQPKKQNIQEHVLRLQLLLDSHLLLQQEARKQHLAKGEI